MFPRRVSGETATRAPAAQFRARLNVLAVCAAIVFVGAVLFGAF